MSTAERGLHEDASQLSAEAVDRHRALVSLREELEAIDWYGQRVAAVEDEELRCILAHNRAEEIEHAVMILEWLRRSDERFAEELRSRLFREGPIVPERGEEVGESRDLNIGSLKGGDRQGERQ